MRVELRTDTVLTQILASNLVCALTHHLSDIIEAGNRSGLCSDIFVGVCSDMFLSQCCDIWTNFSPAMCSDMYSGSDCPGTLSGVKVWHIL